LNGETRKLKLKDRQGKMPTDSGVHQVKGSAEKNEKKFTKKPKQRKTKVACEEVRVRRKKTKSIMVMDPKKGTPKKRRFSDIHR